MSRPTSVLGQREKQKFNFFLKIISSSSDIFCSLKNWHSTNIVNNGIERDKLAFSIGNERVNSNLALIIHCCVLICLRIQPKLKCNPDLGGIDSTIKWASMVLKLAKVTCIKEKIFLVSKKRLEVIRIEHTTTGRILTPKKSFRRARKSYRYPYKPFPDSWV